MIDVMSNMPQKIQNSKFKILNWFWLLPAIPVTLLALRFGMRLLGVRPDIPFPGFVYAMTAPIVEPFYRFSPVSERFDYYAVEWAGLLAVGCILAAALAVYVAGLLLDSFITGRGEEPSTSDLQT